MEIDFGVCVCLIGGPESRQRYKCKRTKAKPIAYIVHANAKYINCWFTTLGLKSIHCSRHCNVPNATMYSHIDEFNVLHQFHPDQQLSTTPSKRIFFSRKPNLIKAVEISVFHILYCWLVYSFDYIDGEIYGFFVKSDGFFPSLVYEAKRRAVPNTQ